MDLFSRDFNYRSDAGIKINVTELGAWPNTRVRMSVDFDDPQTKETIMSKILEQIRKDRLQARKDRDTFTATTLTTLLGEASPSGNDTISDKEVQKVIEKFAKNQRSMLAHDLSALQRSQINKELQIYEKYLPKQLTAEDIHNILVTEYTICVDGEGSGNLNMGAIMRYLSSNYAGQYDGKVASKAVKEFIDHINGLMK